MTEQEKQERKAEKKIRKAVKRYAKVNPRITELRTHTFANGKRYLITIYRVDK